MPADVPFHLGRGDIGPVQQSPLTCGSAALTVARMLVSPECARWIVGGLDPKGGPPDPRSKELRFADYEHAVMNRTNGFRAADHGQQWNFPWPRAFGTPPWGARRELAHGGAQPGAVYAMRWVRLGSSDALRGAYCDLVGLVREGLPALLYLGNTWLPRHVVLVLPGNGAERLGGDDSARDGWLDVYDPATGSVTELVQERFASRTLGIAGWNIPWITVQPRPH